MWERGALVAGGIIAGWLLHSFHPYMSTEEWIGVSIAGTWALVAITYFMMRAQVDTFREESKVRWVLNRRDVYEDLVPARRAIATALVIGVDTRPDRILSFFEIVGLLFKRGYLDKELTSALFCYGAVRYWKALHAYVDADQRRHPDLWTHYKFLVDQISGSLMTSLTREDVQTFLQEESELRA